MGNEVSVQSGGMRIHIGLAVMRRAIGEWVTICYASESSQPRVLLEVIIVHVPVGLHLVDYQVWILIRSGDSDDGESRAARGKTWQTTAV